MRSAPPLPPSPLCAGCLSERQRCVDSRVEFFEDCATCPPGTTCRGDVGSDQRTAGYSRCCDGTRVPCNGNCVSASCGPREWFSVDTCRCECESPYVRAPNGACACPPSTCPPSLPLVTEQCTCAPCPPRSDELRRRVCRHALRPESLRRVHEGVRAWRGLLQRSVHAALHERPLREAAHSLVRERSTRVVPKPRDTSAGTLRSTPTIVAHAERHARRTSDGLAPMDSVCAVPSRSNADPCVGGLGWTCSTSPKGSICLLSDPSPLRLRAPSNAVRSATPAARGATCCPPTKNCCGTTCCAAGEICCGTKCCPKWTGLLLGHRARRSVRRAVRVLHRSMHLLFERPDPTPPPRFVRQPPQMPCPAGWVATSVDLAGGDLECCPVNAPILAPINLAARRPARGAQAGQEA
jgi:hypothetical protein